MRATEFITEVFQPGKTNWKWRRQSSDEAFASFIVADREYQWHAFTSEANLTKWEIQFRLMRVPTDPDGLDLFGTTGTGNSAEVLSTAVDITREFIKQYGLDKVEEITFNAKEDSRIGLYAKMINRLLPDWDLYQKYSKDKGMEYHLTDRRAYDKPENKTTEGQGVAEGVNNYLWHGSKTKHSVLYPQQADDTGGKEESNKNAVYATPIAKVAIAMGLTIPGSDTGMFPNDPQMVLFKGGIRKGQMVYLHKVPKDLFIKHNDREWYSKPGVKEVKPIEVVAVPVDKWLHLIRQATPQDLELQKKNLKKQGVAEVVKMPPTKNSSQGMADWAYKDALDKKATNKGSLRGIPSEIYDMGDHLRVFVLDNQGPVLYLALNKFLNGFKSGAVAVDPRGRGQNLAVQVYQATSDTFGRPIYSDTTQTDASRIGIWQKLISAFPNRVVGYDQKTQEDLPLTYTDQGPAVRDNQPIYVQRNAKDQPKPMTSQDRSRTRLLKLLPTAQSKQGVAEGLLREFAPSGQGERDSGRWYTDDELADIIGDDWFEDFDVSHDEFNIDTHGEKAKQNLASYANSWFDDRGYNVNVMGVEHNDVDHDLKWYIEGSFHNPRFAEQGVAEGLKHTLRKFDPTIKARILAKSQDQTDQGLDTIAQLADMGLTSDDMISRAMKPNTYFKNAERYAKLLAKKGVAEAEKTAKVFHPQYVDVYYLDGPRRTPLLVNRKVPYKLIDRYLEVVIKKYNLQKGRFEFRNAEEDPVKVTESVDYLEEK